MGASKNLVIPAGIAGIQLPWRANLNPLLQKGGRGLPKPEPANMNLKTEPRKPGEHLEEFQRGIRVARLYKTTRAMINFSYLPDAERAYMCGWNIGVVQNLSIANPPFEKGGRGDFLPESRTHGRENLVTGAARG